MTVDTVGPALTLKGWWAGEDRVRLTLRCEDPHLVRDSVRLRWLSADPAAGWEDVRPAPDEATSWEGLVRIDVARDLDTPFDVSVKAAALDAAGNRSEAILPLPRPSAVTNTNAAERPALRFAAPGSADPPPFADPPPRRPAAAANRVAFAEDPAPAAGGFPVATFPAAAFPVARFRLPDAQPAAAPAPAAGPGGAGWADPLGTGWETAPLPSSSSPTDPSDPAAPAAPAGGPEVLFDLGRADAARAVVPASASVPIPAPSPGRAAAGDADALYERLLAAAPGDRALRLAYADRLAAAGRLEAAARHLRVLLRKDPADAEALRRLTACLPPAR